MNTPLRVGIVGCGNVALNFHLTAYQALPERYVVGGLADPTPERLELGRVVAGLRADQVHLDALDLIRDPRVDVIDICTPQHLHRDLVIAAAAAGKHILCEKPIAATPADAAAMVAAADKADVLLAVVHNYLFFPEVVALRRLIEDGVLGDIRTVSVDMLGVVDSPGAAGYAPRWRHDPASSGGGVLMDMLHGVYLAEHLLGSPISAASAAVDVATPGDPVEGLALCRFEASDGFCLVNVGWGLGPGGVTVNGTRGRAVAHYRDNGTMPWAPFESLTVTTAEGTRTIDLPAGEELGPLITHAMRDTVADLFDAVTAGRPPAATGKDAQRILDATVAAYASGALRRTVEIPLSPDSSLHHRGVVGLADLDLPASSPVRRRGLFSVQKGS